MQQAYTYVGEELDLFALAINWKRYWHSKISPFLGAQVLEVGAGIGATTRVLLEDNPHYDLWLGLEPDTAMVADLIQSKEQGQFPAYCQFQVGTIEALSPGQRFDSILYIDVLEHIEHDAAEIALAAEHLSDGGYLIVLSPAYQYLYSEFDKSIGHFRRYDRQMLAALTPPTLKTSKALYVDSMGLLTSLSNRLLLHAPLPTRRQILLWDRVLVPLSKITDPLSLYRVGRSIIYVWQKKPTG